MAQRLNHETNASADIFHPSESMRKNRTEHLHPLLKLAAIGSVALTAFGFGAKAVERNIEPIDYSQETTTITAEPGDGLYNIAARIPGSEQVPQDLLVDHIARDPANIEILENGLQVDDAVTVSVSVKAHE